MNHEKCRHCGGKMSHEQPVLSGPHAGQTKIACFKCGHIEYLAHDTQETHRVPSVAPAPPPTKLAE